MKQVTSHLRKILTVISVGLLLINASVTTVLIYSLSSETTNNQHMSISQMTKNYTQKGHQNLITTTKELNQQNKYQHNHQSNKQSSSYFPSSYNILSKNENYLMKPLRQKLNVYPSYVNSQNSFGYNPLAISLNPPSDFAIRGTTVVVKGQLKSAIPGDYWDGETVLLFYNVTESQYVANQTFYNNNPNYYVGSDVTDSEGYFEISLTTSTLSSDAFSKIGVINLLTWFNGDPAKGRGAGSPGSLNVTFYGTMQIDVTASVTNPGPSSTYSYTTQIKFDNGTIVNTAGTQYHLKIEWSVDGVHTDTNYTFDASNSHTYTNTPPNTVQTVTYQAWYDISQLSLTYFTRQGASDPTTEKTLYYTRQDQTQQQVFADGYFVVGSTKQKTPIEIPLDSSFKIYANLSDETGALASKTIVVSFRNNGVEFDSVSLTTNSSGEVEYVYTLSHNDFPDITKSFTIVFSPLASENLGATLTSTQLNAILAVNITSIEITISNKNIFYTPGEQIQYSVIIKDEYGRVAPSTLFNLNFPGLGVVQHTSSSGTTTLTTTIPDYSGADQTQNKTIIVSALNVTGSNYRYIALANVVSNDTFDIYFSLTMKLLDPSGAIVVSGSTWNAFNNSFASAFNSGYYNFSVLDQWGRKPIGALIQISFAGRTVSFHVNSTQNWVLYTNNDLAASGLNLSEAHTGLLLAAHYGEYNYQDSITQTITIYGPDNDAPTIGGVVLNPDPFIPPPHAPIFNVTFTILATDVGTGIRYVLIWYQLWSINGSAPVTGWNFINCTYVGNDTYVGQLIVRYINSQQYVHYYLEVKDYAGWGLLLNGSRQPTPQYDSNFGLQSFIYLDNPKVYRLGDYEPPTEERTPDVESSLEAPSPYANITVYVNDSLIYTGVSYVEIHINITNVLTQELANVIVDNMTHIPNTNQWYYYIALEFNYNYTWYYVAYDNAYPVRHGFKSGLRYIDVSDKNPPVLTNFNIKQSTATVGVNTVLNFTINATDAETGIAEVRLIITYLDNTTIFVMTNIGGNTYFISIDLSTFPLPPNYGSFPLIYKIEAADNANNVAITTPNSITVSYPAPPAPHGTQGANLGGIIGGVIGGIIVIIAVLFLWYNRHSLRTYAAAQTLRRRLQDYLREILDEIRRDGLEGRYRDGLLKVWAVTEGIGREFFDLPRYKSQTPAEFANRFAEKTKIDKSTLITIVNYFNKARYGHEKITENDFNSGVRALHKLIEKLEEGEIKIES